MNPLTPWIVSVAFFIVLIACVYAFRAILNQKTGQVKDLTEENEMLRKNELYLYNHAEEIAEIRDSKERIDNEIHKAKTDNEILEIINAIVSTNNDRLRK